MQNYSTVQYSNKAEGFFARLKRNCKCSFKSIRQYVPYYTEHRMDCTVRMSYNIPWKPGTLRANFCCRECGTNKAESFFTRREQKSCKRKAATPNLLYNPPSAIAIQYRNTHCCPTSLHHSNAIKAAQFPPLGASQCILSSSPTPGSSSASPPTPSRSSK